MDITFDGFNAETTILRFSEGQTVTFEMELASSGVVTASLSQISGPTIDFGEMSQGGIDSDGDIMNSLGREDVRFTLQDLEGPRVAVFDNLFTELTVEFIAPSVTRQTTLTLQFRSSDGTQSRTRSIPIIIEDDAGAITVSGQVSKGLVSNTEVELFSVEPFLSDLLGSRQIVEPVRIDEMGNYTFTLLPSIEFEDLLLFEVEGDGADMICDAPQGCNQIPFGQTFEVEDDLDLQAYIPVPQLGTTQTVNINILTTLTASSAQNLTPGSLTRVDPDDVESGEEEVANVFGLPDQDFTTVPFVDVTRPITSTNENAIRVAMIGGGVLGAVLAQSDPDDEDDYLEELDDFIDDFGDGDVACQNSPSQTTASIEDVMSHALDVARINGSFTTQNFFSRRLAGIRNGSVDCDFTERAP